MNNTVKGFSISFVFHGAILYTLLSAAALLPEADMARVIDFSLVERSGASPQKIDNNRQAIKAPPALETAASPPPAPIMQKISVPAQPKEVVAEPAIIPTPEPLPIAEDMAENVTTELPMEEPVAPGTETKPPVIPEPSSPGLHSSAAPANDDLGLIKENYLGANLHYIKDNIQKRISYPPIARKMSWEGKVIVSFVVDMDGRVLDIHIIKSSGFAILDKNAIDTIKKAAPYSYPPVKVELVVPVIYRLA